MRSELDGGNVKSIITAGTGYKESVTLERIQKFYRYKYDGLRRRRNLRGNTISTDTRQLNLKVVEYGKKSLGSILGDEERNRKGMMLLAESKRQPEVNIGMVGHVDHGKTTLTKVYLVLGQIHTRRKEKRNKYQIRICRYHLLLYRKWRLLRQG